MRYYTIDKEDLPSKGLFYDSSIEMMPLSFGQAKFLCSKTNENSKSICDILLKENISGIKVEDLLLGDYNYLLLWLRANSFLNQADFSYTITCPYCHKEYSETKRCSKLEFKYATKRSNSQRIAGYDIRFHYPMNTEIQKSTGNRMIDIIKNTSNVDDFIDDLLELDYDTFYAIYKEANNWSIGIDPVIASNCTMCNNTNYINLDLNHENILMPMNIMDIIKAQLQISKYTNYIIHDDDPFNEFIITQQVVKQMVDEDNKQIEESRKSAKSGSNNFSMGSFLSKFK